jgi:hypothetical protein
MRLIPAAFSCNAGGLHDENLDNCYSGRENGK